MVKGSKYSSSLNIDQKLYYLAKLEIINAEEVDSGDYKVEAVNVHGKCVANVNLNFNDEKGHLKWVQLLNYLYFNNCSIIVLLNIIFTRSRVF